MVFMSVMVVKEVSDRVGSVVTSSCCRESLVMVGTVIMLTHRAYVSSVIGLDHLSSILKYVYL